MLRPARDCPDLYNPWIRSFLPMTNFSSCFKDKRHQQRSDPNVARVQQRLPLRRPGWQQASGRVRRLPGAVARRHL